MSLRLLCISLIMTKDKYYIVLSQKNRRLADRQVNRWIDRQTVLGTDRLADEQTDNCTNRELYRWIDMKKDGKINRQTSKADI